MHRLFRFGLVVGELSWLRHEDWLKEESYIGKLPRDLVVYDEVVKKVYEDGVEFHGGKNREGVEEVRQALRNLALVKFAPELESVLVRMLPFGLDDAIREVEVNNFVRVEDFNRVGLKLKREDRSLFFDWWIKWVNR